MIGNIIGALPAVNATIHGKNVGIVGGGKNEISL
jgi:hypothetical protein